MMPAVVIARLPQLFSGRHPPCRRAVSGSKQQLLAPARPGGCPPAVDGSPLPRLRPLLRRRLHQLLLHRQALPPPHRVHQPPGEVLPEVAPVLQGKRGGRTRRDAGR